jgi:hypothetical protein
MAAILDPALGAERMADIAANAKAMGEPVAYHFNDDDVYVVDARTLKIVRHIGCKSCEYIGASLHGFRAYPGQMVLKGLQARHMGERA